MSAAWLEEDIKEALLSLSVLALLIQDLGCRCMRCWGSRKVQLRNIPALLFLCVALICVSEVLETVQPWQWGIQSAQMIIWFSGESCSPCGAQGKTTAKKKKKKKTGGLLTINIPYIYSFCGWMWDTKEWNILKINKWLQTDSVHPAGTVCHELPLKLFPELLC